MNQSIVIYVNCPSIHTSQNPKERLTLGNWLASRKVLSPCSFVPPVFTGFTLRQRKDILSR